MALGTAFGWANLATTGAAVALAFFFGYVLTALPCSAPGSRLRR
jgi:hypothetical protein